MTDFEQNIVDILKETKQLIADNHKDHEARLRVLEDKAAKVTGAMWTAGLFGGGLGGFLSGLFNVKGG